MTLHAADVPPRRRATLPWSAVGVRDVIASPRGGISGPRLWWALFLMIPGGLILAAAALIAWPGIVLIASSLRRLTAVLPERIPALERSTPTHPGPRASFSWPPEGGIN